MLVVQVEEESCVSHGGGVLDRNIDLSAENVLVACVVVHRLVLHSTSTIQLSTLSHTSKEKMLPFIPRNVARKAVKPQRPNITNTLTDDHGTADTTQAAGPSNSVSHQPVPRSADPAPPPSLKGKERETDASKLTEAYANLLQLSLSDHALWLDADLRRTVESNGEGCA